MQQLMDQQTLIPGLVTGNRLDQDVVLLSFIMHRLRRSLQSEVRSINRSISLNSVGSDMKEVRDLATGLKESIAAIKKASLDARSGLDAEIARSQINAEKVKSFTNDLKEANQEVESFLGESNSNFPSSEDSNTQQHASADKNGVTLNTEASK